MGTTKAALFPPIDRTLRLVHGESLNSLFGSRYMSLARPPPVPPVITGTAVSKDETRDFMAVFPDIVRDLTETGRNLDIPDVTKWLVKVWVILFE